MAFWKATYIDINKSALTAPQHTSLWQRLLTKIGTDDQTKDKRKAVI